MLFLICLVINIKVLRLQYFYDKEMTKKQLMEETNISKSTMDKMGRNEKVSMEILDRLCSHFSCDVSDIIEHIDEVEKQ